MNIDELIEKAREFGFVDLKAIRSLARCAVELTPLSPSDQAPPLGSRLGGLPALPESVPWPQKNGKSLAFIAQIDLGAQPRLPFEQGFPPDGLLLFFYDAEQRTWGVDPKDAGGFVVIFVPTDAHASVVADWPSDIPEDARYRPCGLAPSEIVALPPEESVFIDYLMLDSGQSVAFGEIFDETYNDDVWSQRGILGGYPDQIQGDMMLECAIISAGFQTFDDAAYQESVLPALREKAHEWRLLLQIPSSEAVGMEWGDAGCLYYCIRDDDLRARRFDRCWMIMHCG